MRKKIIAVMLILILSLQIPILNENISAEPLPIDAIYSNPQSIKLQKGDKIATTYSAQYTAMETVNANQRTLLPIIKVDRTSEFIPLSHDTIYSVAWLNSGTTRFTYESRLIENAYGIGWLEQNSIFNQNERYGYNALHSLLKTEYPTFISRTNENGIINIDASRSTERTNGGSSNLITQSLLGIVKFENGDININNQIIVSYNFSLPNEAASAGNNYYAEYTWNEPSNTDVDMELILDNENSLGTINFTFNSGYFYQTREINYGGIYLRYWAIPFSVFIHYYPSSTRSEALNVNSINFAPRNSIGKEVLLTENQRIEKEFQGYKISGIIVNKNINIYRYETYSTETSRENSQYLYNLDDNYLDRNIFAITNIRKYNGARDEITAVSLPYVIIGSTSYMLTSDLKQDLKDVYGIFLNSADINRGIAGFNSPNLNTNSQENFYSYYGSTIDIVYSVDIALIFVKFVIYNNTINFYVEVFTKDGNQYPMKIIQYWDVSPIGRTYYHIGTASREWIRENSGEVNSRVSPERYIRTRDANDNGEVSLYGNNDYINSTGYALLNNGVITDNPRSEDDDEIIRDNDTVLYYVTPTEVFSAYNINTMSYAIISPSVSSPEHEFGITSFSVPDADLNTEFDITVKVINNEVITDRVGIALFIDNVFYSGIGTTLNSAEERTYTLKSIVSKSGYHNAKIELIPLFLEDRFLSNNFDNKTFFAGVEISILSPKEGDTVQSNTKIVVSTLGPIKSSGGVQYRINNSAWTNLNKDEGNKWSVYWNTKTVSNGNYKLEVRAMTNKGITATDSINITVNNPPDVYNVELYTELTSKTVNPRSTVTYLIIIENLGNVPDSYDLSTIGGGSLSVYFISLNPSESKNFTLSVSAPSTAKDGDFYNITVIAKSKNSNEKAELFTSTLVKDVIMFGVEIKAIDKIYAGIGTKTDTMITIKNIGVNQDVMNLKITSSIENIATLEKYNILLNSQQEGKVKLTINLPSNLENNSEIIITITATSTQDSSKFATKQIKVIATTETNPRYGFEIKIVEKEKKGYQGSSVSFILNLKNIGNRPDNIILDIVLPENWSFVVNSSVYLDLSEIKDIILIIDIPESATKRKYTVSINANSENDTNISKNIKITVDVEIKRIIIFEVSVDNNTKIVRPGVSATFYINILNKGNYEESFEFIAVSETKVLPSYIPDITISPKQKEDIDLKVLTSSEEKEINITITIKSKTNESIAKTLILKVIVKKGDEQTPQPSPPKFFIPLINYCIMLIAIILLAIIKKRRQKYGK